MRRPKWLNGCEKGTNSLEGSLIIDIPDIKVVEASFNKKLALLAVGTSPQNETIVSGETKITAGEKHRTSLEWKIFYDSTALPNSIPVDKARDFMAGTVAVLSGSGSVFSASTVYIASSNRPSKGNAPVLLDYEMVKKIEEARKTRRIQ